MKAATHWAWLGGWVAEANRVVIIGLITMLAAVTAGAPVANRDPLASASAPAMRRYRAR